MCLAQMRHLLPWLAAPTVGAAGAAARTAAANAHAAYRAALNAQVGVNHVSLFLLRCAASPVKFPLRANSRRWCRCLQGRVPAAHLPALPAAPTWATRSDLSGFIGDGCLCFRSNGADLRKLQVSFAQNRCPAALDALSAHHGFGFVGESQPQAGNVMHKAQLFINSRANVEYILGALTGSAPPGGGPAGAGSPTHFQQAVYCLQLLAVAPAGSTRVPFQLGQAPRLNGILPPAAAAATTYPMPPQIGGLIPAGAQAVPIVDAAWVDHARAGAPFLPPAGALQPGWLPHVAGGALSGGGLGAFLPLLPAAGLDAFWSAPLVPNQPNFNRLANDAELHQYLHVPMPAGVVPVPGALAPAQAEWQANRMYWGGAEAGAVMPRVMVLAFSH